MSFSQRSVGVTVIALSLSQQFDSVTFLTVSYKDLAVSPSQSSLSQQSDSVTLVPFSVQQVVTYQPF
jgi:hypothetical protein